MRVESYILFWERGIEFKICKFRFFISRKPHKRKLWQLIYFEVGKDYNQRINFTFWVLFIITISYQHQAYEKLMDGNYLTFRFCGLHKKWVWNEFEPSYLR